MTPKQTTPVPAKTKVEARGFAEKLYPPALGFKITSIIRGPALPAFPGRYNYFVTVEKVAT